MLTVFVVACSGTDVGYPRANAISACATGGDSATGGTLANSGGTTSGAGRSSGGALITGGNKAAGGSAGGASVASGGASSAGAVSQAGAQSTGGLVSNGGQSVGGASGSASAGAAGNGGAVGGATSGFPWPVAYDAAAAPMPADGHHNPGTSCMSSVCHGTKVPFVYGGTVYKADGVTVAANVQVGIFDGVSTLVTYSAQNGNIWLPSSAGAVSWANATIALRNKNGERVKPATAPREAACNGTGCHNAAKRLLEP